MKTDDYAVPPHPRLTQPATPRLRFSTDQIESANEAEMLLLAFPGDADVTRAILQALADDAALLYAAQLDELGDDAIRAFARRVLFRARLAEELHRRALAGASADRAPESGEVAR